MSFCGNCGSSLANGATFCGECGRATNELFAATNVRAASPDAQTTVLPKIVPATPEPAPTPTPAPTATRQPVVTPPITTVVGTLPATPTSAAYNAPAAQHEPQPHSGGQQGPQPGRGGLMIALALLGICAVGLGIYLVNNSKNSSKDSSKDSTGSTIAGASTSVGTTTPGETIASTIPIDPNIAAAEQLSALVAQDRPTADTLVGSWVVQLSAKRVGLKADGITYAPVEILADHTTLRTTYSAIIVDAGAFQFTSGGSPMTGWFLSIVPQANPSKDLALQWCSDRGLTSNVCLARQFKPPNP